MPRSPRRLFRTLLTTALLAATLPLGQALAQDGQDAYPITPMTSSWVRLHGHRFNVEVAQTNAQRARGLMFRDHLAAGHGMLFIHEGQGPLAYWMKNTRIGLDIFYFDAQRKLVSVSKNTPPCDMGDACPPYRSEGPAMYVLELNAGVADKLHTRKGDTLTFGPGIPPAPPPASEPAPAPAPP